MNHQFDILVIGGGIVGLAAALSMAARGCSVAIIDAGDLAIDLSKPDLRVYAINHASQQLLAKLGVWQHMDVARLSPYRHMHVWDGINGAYIDFDSRDIAAKNLGTIIEESVLKEALLRQVSQTKSIQLFPHCAVDDVLQSEDGIEIKSKEMAWQGQLLMIADGANSPTREKLNVELTTWSYEQQALVATVAIEKEHQRTAYQVFHPDGPLAFLPLANPHQCSIVWSTSPERVKTLMALDEKSFNEQLTRAFSGELGRVELMSLRHQFPLQMRHVKQYTGKRWLLLGDAAHTIHPLAGLGLNVGLADVSSWVSHLNVKNLISNKSLSAYQRERKSSVWQIILLMEGLKRVFGFSQPAVISLRGFGLRFCNQFSPLKRLLIEHAAGKNQSL